MPGTGMNPHYLLNRVVSCTLTVCTMKVLIFVLLALAVDAHTYWSNNPSWGYGSSLYGSSYGSGLGYGSGISYGSGLGYGSGISYGSGLGYGSGYSSGIGSYSPITYQTARYQEPVHAIDYSHEGAPENVALVIDDGGYQAGKSPISRIEAWNSPAAPRSQKTVHRSVVQTVKSVEVPQSVFVAQDFSKGSGQLGHHGSGGAAKVSTFQKTVAPAAVFSERDSTGIIGSLHDSAHHGVTGDVSGVQEIDGIGGHVSTAGVADAGYVKTSPVAAPFQKPSPVFHQRTTPIHRTGGQASWKNAVAPGKITFTQDFSRVIGSGPSEQSALQGLGEISTLRQPISPPRIVLEKPAEVLPQRATPFHHRGSQGTAAGVAPGKISFIQDFSRVSGQSTLQRTGGNVGLNLQKPIAPARIIPERLPYQKPTYTRDYVSGKAPGHISFTLGGTGYQTGKSAIAGAREWSSPVAPRPSYGQRNIGTLPRRTAQAVSGAGPARISFTQDFSKVTSHQTPGAHQVAPTLDKLAVPAYPGAISSGRYDDYKRITLTAPKPVQRPVIQKLELKAPKQPISQEPALTTIYEQSPANGAIGGSIGHIQSIDGGIGDQRTYYTGDKSNILMGFPAAGNSGDKSSALSFSSNINPAGGFVEEKGSVYQLSSGIVDSASLQANQGQGGYSAVSTPFKNYYSSSYPSYSHVSGESPRFDFSPDRSLLYTYSSPYLVSPFSYTYSSGKAQYGQLQKKAA